SELIAPDLERMAGLPDEPDRSRLDLSRQEGPLDQLESAPAPPDAPRPEASDTAQSPERERPAPHGHPLTLHKIQSHGEENGQIQDWIERHQLAAKPRMWQKIRVDSGWETAVESVLRERLHALELSDAELLQRLAEDPPPAKVNAFVPGEAPG